MRIAEARTDLDEVGDENIECEGRLMILDDETIEDKKIKDKEGLPPDIMDFLPLTKLMKDVCEEPFVVHGGSIPI